jgi:cell division protein FtsW (lipid II flippase)
VLEPGGPASAQRLPRLLLVAVWVAVVQAAGLAVFAAAVVVQAVRGDRSTVENVALLALLLVAWAAGLLVAARGLLRLRRWARAPLVVCQLLLLAVGLPLVQGSGARWAGGLLVVSAAAGLVCVLSPPVTARLTP